MDTYPMCDATSGHHVYKNGKRYDACGLCSYERECFPCQVGGLPLHDAIPKAKDTRAATPMKGKPYTIGAQTITPTYVAESEAPKGDGSCLTHDYATDKPIKAAGWYVEFRYDTDGGHPESGQHRGFIPFDGSRLD